MFKKAIYFIFILSLSGCSSIVVHLPTAFTTKIREGGHGRKVVVTMPFEDGRGMREVKICGEKKWNIISDGADIYCSTSPIEWLPTLLKRELKRAGFEVLDEDDGSTDVIFIEGKLLRFYTEADISSFTIDLESQVIISLVYKAKSGVMVRENIRANYSEGALELWTANYQGILSESARQAVLHMVLKTIDVIGNNPELN